MTHGHALLVPDPARAHWLRRSRALEGGCTPIIFNLIAPTGLDVGGRALGE